MVTLRRSINGRDSIGITKQRKQTNLNKMNNHNKNNNQINDNSKNNTKLQHKRRQSFSKQLDIPTIDDVISNTQLINDNQNDEFDEKENVQQYIVPATQIISTVKYINKNDDSIMPPPAKRQRITISTTKQQQSITNNHNSSTNTNMNNGTMLSTPVKQQITNTDTNTMLPLPYTTSLIDTTPVKHQYAVSHHASSEFDAAMNADVLLILSPRASIQNNNKSVTSHSSNNHSTPMQHTTSNQHPPVPETPLVKHNRFDIDDNNNDMNNIDTDEYDSVMSYDNLPDPYLTINPSLLDDHNWSYRDLQTLCKQVNVRASGKRIELVDRLVVWHQQQFDDNKRAEQIQGSNFSMLQIKLPNIEQHPMCSPLLTKIKYNNVNQSNNNHHVLSSPIPTRSILSATPRLGTEFASTQKKSIQFSVFNSVKLIPAREYDYTQQSSDTDEYDSDDELNSHNISINELVELYSNRNQHNQHLIDQLNAAADDSDEDDEIQL